MFNREKYQRKREEERRKTEEFNRKRKEVEFEKGDVLALILAALTTILPIALVTILGIWFLSTLMFKL